MDGMILKRGGDPSKLKTITETYVATEGQTQFPIEYSTFDYKKDTVFVISGRTILTPELDYTLVGNKVALVEGVPKDRTVTIRIMKNVNTDAEDKTMSGAYIEPNSIPSDRLVEEFLPLTGGTLKGSLGLTDNIGVARVKGNQYGLYLCGGDETEVQRQLVVVNPSNPALPQDLQNALVLATSPDGNEWDAMYKVYGEHNVTKSPTDIVSGSALGNGCIHLVYE